jgi:subtilisin family serine protease
MMKKHIILLIIGLASGCAAAHNLDNISRACLNAPLRKAHLVAKSDNSQYKYYPLLLEINSEDAIDVLNNSGAVIYYRRANFVLATVPVEAIPELDNLASISRASIARKTTLTTDVARSFSNIDAVHTPGSADIAGYDGTGVVTGICDTGFDPNHVAFKDRLQMMSKYDEYNAKRSVYAPNSTLETSTTFPTIDTHEETHATHTTNIMAGGRENNPYYGAAPGSDLVVSTSSLTEMGLLCGIEDAIAFGKERNEPVVVNLSVSSSTGPHDGTDITSEYLNLVGKEAIICFSAGNSGAQSYSIQHDFANDDETFGSMIESSVTWSGYDIQGAIDLWSGDANPFEVQLVAYDQVDKKFVYESEWIAGLSDDGYFTLENGDNEVWDTNFPNSYISVSFGTDKRNGRYNVSLYYEINPVEDLPGGNHWARYICGWRTRAKAGTHIDGYTDGVYSFFRKYGVEGMSQGNALQSISNLCCAENVISVGSCNSRNKVPVEGDFDEVYTLEPGTVSSWSSYGTLINGKVLPDICAPGNMVVSAINSEFEELYPNVFTVAHSVEIDGKKHYWAAWRGTSMSSPLVAGIIALWLQADPQLSVQEARKIMQTTAQTDYTDITDPHWGSSGCIDAYAGLKYLLNSGVNNIKISDPIFTVSNRQIISTAPVQIFDAQGRAYDSSNALTPGLYIVKAGAQSRKVVIK